MKLRTSTNPAGFMIKVGGAAITVRPMSSTALASLRHEHTTFTRSGEEVNGAELAKEMFDRVVLAWDDTVKDENGKPLPCTTENKRAVAEYDSAFVGEVLATMDAADKMRRLGEEGNSKPGPSGTSPQAK